jgi:serine phosphatase RsbU (regulator of sigma subunit)
MKNTAREENRPISTVSWPKWVGYLVTLALEVIFMLALWLLNPYFPLGEFPFTYILLMMAVSYLFGEGPAILAFVLGFLMFDFLYVPPIGSVWALPSTREGEARWLAFLLGTSVVGISMLMIRRSKLRIQQLAQELDREMALEVEARQRIQQSYEREHRIAELLETSLVGAIPEKIDGFGFDTHYRAALEEARVGGDFYDVFRIDGNSIGILIGDVSGKGLSAAVQVAMARYSLRSRIYDSRSPSQVLGQVNRSLFHDMEADSFITVFVGVLNCVAKLLTYANGGHMPAIVWSASEKRAVLLPPTGPLVGAIADATFEERIVPLQTGDEILLGTDGLYEVGCGKDLLGVEGLLSMYEQSMRTEPPSAAELVDQVEGLCDGILRDDIAILRISVME